MIRRTLTLAGLAALLLGAGWRDSIADAELPASFETITWSTPLPDGSWSSPVVHNGRVYLTSEPTSLHCLDLASGEILWTRTHDVRDAMNPTQIAEFEASKATADALAAERRGAQERMGKLRKDVRRGRASKEDVEALQERIEQIGRELHPFAAFHLPARGDGMGYAIPTPHVDGKGVVAAFANGMVASWSLAGELRWRRWLGVGEQPTRGYQGTDAASVLVAGGVAMVTHGKLYGLDLATGKVRWTGPAYSDYGTPALMEVGGRTVALTPDGHAIDASTGAELASELGSTWYVGPTVVGHEAWWVGRDDGEFDAPIRVVKVKASTDGSSVRFEQVYSKELDVKDRIYGNPVMIGDHLVGVTVKRRVISIDATSGTLRRVVKLDGIAGNVWTSPVRVGDEVVVTTRGGGLAVLDPSSLAIVRSAPWLETVSRPAFLKGAVVTRDGTSVQRRGG